MDVEIVFHQGGVSDKAYLEGRVRIAPCTPSYHEPPLVSSSIKWQYLSCEVAFLIRNDIKFLAHSQYTTNKAKIIIIWGRTNVFKKKSSIHPFILMYYSKWHCTYKFKWAAKHPRRGETQRPLFLKKKLIQSWYSNEEPRSGKGAPLIFVHCPFQITSAGPSPVSPSPLGFPTQVFWSWHGKCVIK